MPGYLDVSEKAQRLLKLLVERYIEEGQPVGSKKLSETSDVQMSPATIRNIMSDLEEKGYVVSPHTSAGRIPTARAYRLFVDSMIQVEPLARADLQKLSRKLDPDMSSQELVESASGMLSEVTHMAGIVTIPKPGQVYLRQVEFLGLNDNRVLVIMVLDDHEVQNRIIYTQQKYSEAQLKEASNYINQSFIGQTLRNVRAHLISSMKSDRESMNSVMRTTLEMAEKAFDQESAPDYVLAGQENLLDLYQAQAMADLRELFKAFSLKGDILHLLDRCMESDGVQLFIGHEAGYDLLDECSVVTSPYRVRGELVGVLGVIGPTRMAYNRVIPVVDATAKILSAALDASRPA